MNLFLLHFIPLFVATDPIGILPVFVTVTAGCPAATRRKLVLEAVPMALGIGVAFFLAGGSILSFLGLQLADLQIAGGLVLVVFAVMDLLVVGKPEIQEGQSVGIVPLATPILIGPAVLTAGLVLIEKHKSPMLAVAALAANLLIAAVLMLGAEFVLRWIPMNAMKALSKVIDLLLAAIGVAFVREGVLATWRAALNASVG